MKLLISPGHGTGKIESEAAGTCREQGGFSFPPSKIAPRHPTNFAASFQYGALEGCASFFTVFSDLRPGERHTERAIWRREQGFVSPPPHTAGHHHWQRLLEKEKTREPVQPGAGRTDIPTDTALVSKAQRAAAMSLQPR